MNESNKTISDFLQGKTAYTHDLFSFFIDECKKIGTITVHPAKTMIGIANDTKRIAWITQLGKNFIHVVFPFQKPYPDNLCFTKIAQVPGDAKQFNHHFRMFSKEDMNEEIKHYIKLAYNNEDL